MALTLRISHRTEYRYDRPVALGPHRLMVRPRDGHDLWVLDASLLIEPKAELRWHFDTFGNSVALADFTGQTDTLVIRSDLSLRRYALDAAAFAFKGGSSPYPFSYSEDERIDLAPFTALHNPGDLSALEGWLATVFQDRPGDALGFLSALGDAVNRSFAYSARDELGTQSAAATIARGGGTCRDFAFLFMEAARSFGFAARFVTGYLHDPGNGGDGGNGGEGVVGGGATHAWADIYVPGSGWVEFDPTNRIVGGGALVRVAETRTPAQASPITGTFTGPNAILLAMDVSVEVSEEQGGD